MTCLPSHQNTLLLGHDEPVASFLAARASGRLHHAFLLCGAEGIGKATFAFKAARYLLSQTETPREGKDDAGAGLFGALLPLEKETVSKGGKDGFDVPDDSFSARHVAGLTHPDLMVVQRLSEDGKSRKDISVEQIREVGKFLSLTPSMGGYRVVIIDAADDLNTNAANALLKILEEPPAQAILLLVSHRVGRLLPTIRSRCARLKFLPLSRDNMEKVMTHFGLTPEEGHRQKLLHLAAGSPGKLARLIDTQGVGFHDEFLSVLQAPAFSIGAALTFSAKLAGRDAAAYWGLFQEFYLDFMHQKIRHTVSTPEGDKPLETLLTLWDKHQTLLHDADRLNMNKSEVAFACLMELAA